MLKKRTVAEVTTPTVSVHKCHPPCPRKAMECPPYGLPCPADCPLFRLDGFRVDRER
jgi:hypothetical protein